MAEHDLLQGLTVLDRGYGMPMALVAKFLREMGADIIRAVPAGDPFDSVYPAHRAWREGSRWRQDISPKALHQLGNEADICLLGGEDFPGLVRTGNAEQLARQHGKMIILEVTAYPKGMGEGLAVDTLVQARAGLTHEQLSDRATLMSFRPSLYGAAMLGIAGLLAALIERQATGKGQTVFTSLYEGAVFWGNGLWCSVERPDAAAALVIPKDGAPLIFECADGKYVQITFGNAGAKEGVYKVLEIPGGAAENSSGLPSAGMDPRKFFGDTDLIAPYVRKWVSADLIRALKEIGLAAEPVLRPGDCWNEPQIAANRLLRETQEGARIVASAIQVEGVSKGQPAQRNVAEKPLAGTRVIDFGSFLAGPFSSVLLGDLGADVIKVEPLSGDVIRAVFRNFHSCNRGKRTIALDMKHPEGLNIAHRLCESADMVANNFRSGVSARLGLDAASLHQLKPELVVLESPAYGLVGPRSRDAAFDMIMQAFVGHEYRSGGGDAGAPVLVRFSMCDYAGGLLGSIALLLGYYHRSRTGGGSFLSVALLNAALFLLSDLIEQPDGTFAGAPPLNPQLTGFHAAEALYQAANGWIAVAARDEAGARNLLEVLGIRDVPANRAAWGEAEQEAITTAVRALTVDDALTRLENGQVWAEACIDVIAAGTLDDRTLIDNGVLHESSHPTYGVVRQLGPLVSFSRSNIRSFGHSPERGEHSRQILTEFGYNPSEIDRLFAERVVG